MSAACDDECGKRCERCFDRMCSTYGPEPAPCRQHCEDCGNGCLECGEIAAERAAELDFDYANEER